MRLEWPADSTNRSRPSQFGSAGSCRMIRWNSVYATGARLIAVPGWPLPVFCTASMASTRTRSTVRVSSVGPALAGRPAGARSRVPPRAGAGACSTGSAASGPGTGCSELSFTRDAPLRTGRTLPARVVRAGPTGGQSRILITASVVLHPPDAPPRRADRRRARSPAGRPLLPGTYPSNLRSDTAVRTVLRVTQVLPGLGTARLRRSPVPIDVPAERAARRRRGLTVLRAYVALTKPRIVELLLVTTLPAMILAAARAAAADDRCWPRWSAARWPPAAPTR